MLRKWIGHAWSFFASALGPSKSIDGWHTWFLGLVVLTLVPGSPVQPIPELRAAMIGAGFLYGLIRAHGKLRDQIAPGLRLLTEVVTESDEQFALLLVANLSKAKTVHGVQTRMRQYARPTPSRWHRLDGSQDKAINPKRALRVSLARLGRSNELLLLTAAGHWAPARATRVILEVDVTATDTPPISEIILVGIANGELVLEPIAVRRTGAPADG